jgi:hypoxanthine phosphoribosyltransferase
MTETIKLGSKTFKLLIAATEIQRAIDSIAFRMNRELTEKEPLFLSLLNGSFMFTAELMKRLTFNCSVSFVKLSTYRETSSSGNINQLIGLNENIEGRMVVVLEDIVDTGFTLSHFLKELKKFKPAELKVATLFFKPASCIYQLQLDYIGIEIPDVFSVGFGLDYNGLGRNYPDLYQMIS